jgi:hypothetical protein
MTDLPPIISAADFMNIPPRPRRGDRPIVMDDRLVKCRAEALDPVWWQGRQWAVTAFGIEARDGTYTIAANRLAENIDDWGWPAQVTQKDWVDADDFITAWLVALGMHGAPVTAEQVRAAIKRAKPQPQKNRRL